MVSRSGTQPGISTAIAVDSAGQPHITYRDIIPSGLAEQALAPAHMKYTTKIADGWVYETVDRAASNTGHSSDIVIDAQDRPRVSYVLSSVLREVAFDGPHPQSWNLMYAEPASAALGAVGE